MRRSGLLLALPLMLGAADDTAPIMLADGSLRVEVDAARGIVARLEVGGDRGLNFVQVPAGSTARALGDVSLRLRRTDIGWQSPGSWIAAGTRASGDVRRVRADADGRGVTIAYGRDSTSPGGIRGIRLTERLRLDGGTLRWSITLANPQDVAVEVGDLALPLPFNDAFRRETDGAAIYTRYVLRHGAIAGDNSHFAWMRPDGAGPRLVMTPDAGTRLEYFDQPEGEPYVAYVHALAAARDIEPNGRWPERLSAVTLAAAGRPGDRVTYSFAFRPVADDAAIQHRLVEAGLLDIAVAPGMTVPQDLPAMISVRGASAITAVLPQYAGETAVETLPSPAPGRALYRFRFAHPGPNRVTLRWGAGRETSLDYFVTEPLRMLIEKRARFLVDRQQVRDPAKWYDGVFSVWDMAERRLRTPDDTGGLDSFMVGGSDDPDLGKAPFVAAKNLRYPDAREIAALDYYLEHFVWGKLQRTDVEQPHPFGIYGVPNWKESRESPKGLGSGGFGQEKLWRAYDYPHLIQLYYLMYRIARAYPGTTRYLDAQGYLDRAMGTARAYFTVPAAIRMDPYWGFPGYNDWAQKLGIYHELYIPPLIDALEREGRGEQARWLRGEWEKKAKFFIYDSRYPFGSEMFFDTTAFQSAHALTGYALDHPLKPDRDLWRDANSGLSYSHPRVSPADARDAMARAIAANLAARGTWETNFYQYGSDYRAGGMGYLLSYMSQMGGLPILDWGLNRGAPEPWRAIRVGYGSLLSSWALVNSGTPASDYGHWYPGIDNDGAAGWAVTARKWGPTVFGSRLREGRGTWRYDGEIDNGFSEAVEGARTVVADDPLFGLIAYGGTVERRGDGYAIALRDGVQQKLSVRDAGRPLDLELDRDGFAAAAPVMVARDRSRVAFRIEPRGTQAHRTILSATGLAPGRWRMGDRDAVVGRDGRAVVAIDVPAAGDITIELERIAAR